MARLARLIQSHRDEILQRWRSEAVQAAAARALPGPEFMNLMPAYLDALASADEELGEFTGARRRIVESHLAARLRQGFEVDAVVEEFALLGRCIATVWKYVPSEMQPTADEAARLLTELHVTSAYAADLFKRHLVEDAQTEKRYARQLQAIATQTHKPDAAPLTSRLPEVLQLVMDAVSADIGVIHLFEAATAELVTAATAGAVDAPVEKTIAELERPWLEAQRAQPESSSTPESLHISLSGETRSLLAIRLPRNANVAFLYVGAREAGRFTASETRRTEALGMALVAHLESARLHAELLQSVEALRAERDTRALFVSVLAHDLRGPLTSAKMSSHLLIPHVDPAHRRLLDKIIRSVDRADRMIGDLLDTNRIRAGERLPLHLTECDLGALVRETVDDLVITHGARFVVEEFGQLRGWWSADDLRRALWNLAANAVKYGAADAPITLTVSSHEERVLLAVHNEGPPIPVEQQRRLFEPFVRSKEAVALGERGWGLGLTLVRGCAEAHGGKVTVMSDAHAGTTFTMELPNDARAFQIAEGGPGVTSAADLEHALAGVRFPCTRDALLRHARALLAPGDERLALLRSLPEREYCDAADVAAALDEVTRARAAPH